jgi:mRNA-degrading endonuclease RelE of RelBE toxin-antitoxin system
MAFEIILALEPIDDLRRLRTRDRARLRDSLEVHLRHDPTKVSKSRIKRLRGLMRPRYQLRIGDFRVFCDVNSGEAQVLAIVPKAGLAEAGEHAENSATECDQR